MEKEKIKLNFNLKSGIIEIDEYVDKLHEYLLSFQANSIIQMVVSLDNVSKSIIEDLNKINNGEIEGLKILTDDSKTFEKVQKIVEKIDSWKKLIEIAEEFKPEVIEIKEEVVEVKLDKTANIFEQLQEEHYKKNKKKG